MNKLAVHHSLHTRCFFYCVHVHNLLVFKHICVYLLPSTCCHVFPRVCFRLHSLHHKPHCPVPLDLFGSDLFILIVYIRSNLYLTVMRMCHICTYECIFPETCGIKSNKTNTLVINVLMTFCSIERQTG